MKFNTRRPSGYSSPLAKQLVDESKPTYSVSTELTPQQRFEDKKPTGVVIAYKAWFTQAGLPPFEVKFTDEVKLPAYLSVVEFINLQAVEVSYNVYSKADGLKRSNNDQLTTCSLHSPKPEHGTWRTDARRNKLH